MFVNNRSWFTRRNALLSAVVGIIFLLVAVFARGWNWRGLLSGLAGILWLIIAYRQFKGSEPAARCR